MSTVRKLQPKETPTAPNLTAIPGGIDDAGGDDGILRESEGWRRGRPVEDPEKLKPWGFITAKPSEYLIHMRRGKIRRRSTGQGASCFKWPWDSVAIIPTSINRLHFTADQVTREKVGVAVAGLAVYRIVEPEITFRMLNFSYAERASEKLAEILREMFVGAVRRHVANLGVEEVITRRKESIAAELMSELAPVVDGRGRSEDTTSTGWGVVLDSVEIQDVRVLSEAVFRDMQATFRAQLAMRAREAELASAQTIAAREAASAREIQEAKISADVAIREMKAQAESRSTSIEITEDSKRAALKARAAEETQARDHARRLAELRTHAELEAEKARQAEATRLAALAREEKFVASERELRESRAAAARREAELEALLAQQKAEAKTGLDEAESAARARIRQRELELEEVAGKVAAAVARGKKEVENLISDERIQMALVREALPALAGAFAQKIGELRLTQIGGDAADPSSMVTRGIAGVLEVARGFGLGIGGAGERPAAADPAAAPATAAAPRFSAPAKASASARAPLGRPRDDDSDAPPRRRARAGPQRLSRPGRVDRASRMSEGTCPDLTCPAGHLR
ncbi:MAG: SPFH domain-containing protein [Nannocystaceae bacterium]